MIYSSLVAFLHFIGAFGVVLSVFYEWVTYDRKLTLIDAKRIQTADLVYGISAALVLIFGFLRVFYFEKGSEYYLDNLFYNLKLYTFLIAGILSIYPTVRFWKWRKITKAGHTPIFDEKEFVMICWVLRIEVISLVIMIFSASMMAKGFG